MRSRYLPTSPISSLMSFKLTFGCRAQPCHTPSLTVSVLSGPVSTSFSMFQSSAWLTAMSSSLPRLFSFRIRLSATMSSAGRSRKGASSFFPGVASGRLKRFNRATMRPRPSERETISPSSSFAEIFAVHAFALVLARRATSFRRRPPKSSAAIFRSRAGENAESPLPPSNTRHRSASHDVPRVVATSLDRSLDGATERHLDRVRSGRHRVDHTLEPQGHGFDRGFSERWRQVGGDTGKLRLHDEGHRPPARSGDRSLPGRGTRTPLEQPFAPGARDERSVRGSASVDYDHPVCASGHRNRRRAA